MTRVAILVALVACGPPPREGAPGDDTGTADARPDTGGGSTCTAAAMKVYVVDQNNTLSTFTPPATFTDLGTLSCSATGATPFSMGIDRNAMAWILYSDGAIYNVDPTRSPLACTPSAWTSGTEGNLVFGMGFSTDAAGGDVDTLYIAGGGGYISDAYVQLSSVDVTTLPIRTVPIGEPQPGWPELTGNALAELWGFFPNTDGTRGPRVGRFDKQTGVIDPVYGLALGNGGGDVATDWAFAFYGGSYYIFQATIGDTVVYAVDEQGVLADPAGTPTTRKIVGAGVSTCAPVIVGRAP
ncbi:MAG TPA: hypothetical protein VGM88_21545 [Kofleriaceae bacterium]